MLIVSNLEALEVYAGTEKLAEVSMSRQQKGPRGNYLRTAPSLKRIQGQRRSLLFDNCGNRKISAIAKAPTLLWSVRVLELERSAHKTSSYRSGRFSLLLQK